MVDLILDDEIRNSLPELKPFEKEGLEEDILNDGCLDPLVVWSNNGKLVLVDGYHRYDICSEHNIPFKINKLQFKNKAEAMVWALTHQAHRRNWKTYDGIVKALKNIPAIKKLARERQLSGLKQYSAVFQNQKNGESSEPVHINKILSKITGASVDTIAKVKLIDQKVPEETKEKLREGKLSIDKAYQDIKRQERIEKRKEIKIEVGEIKPIIKCGDFRKLIKEIKDDSIDLILTDPPYGQEYLPLWEPLAIEAKRVLKPSGFFISYSGKMYLDEVMNYLSEHLSYYWMGMLYYQGGPILTFYPRRFYEKGRPILFYQKPPFKKQHSMTEDVLISEKPDKTFHKWGQNYEPFIKLIQSFTKEGSVVLDPFLGGGAVAKACFETKRKIIAFEVDKNTYENFISRLER